MPRSRDARPNRPDELEALDARFDSAAAIYRGLVLQLDRLAELAIAAGQKSWSAESVELAGRIAEANRVALEAKAARDAAHARLSGRHDA